MLSSRQFQAGFSLIETLFVLVIIGVLAAAGTYIMLDNAQQARSESVIASVRPIITQIDLEYRETGVMPTLSTLRPFEHPDIRRVSFTRRNDDRLFVKIRVEKDFYTPASNRLAELWYLAEGDGSEHVTWSCGSSPQANRAIPTSILPSYCRETIPRR
ncbi:MAG: type II secretion system protein [Gammaproteobacteria bacterium]